MLFNTFNFVFLFLPICLFFLSIIKRFKNITLYCLFLVLASLYFYSYFLPSYTFILIISILFNFLGARMLSKFKEIKLRKLLFFVIIVLNLLLLIYFKYFSFLIENISFFLDITSFNKNIILPLAISFFTFQQITFITNVYKKEISEFNIIKYSLFICFFPQLIAGPIVKFKEFYPQISNSIKLSLTSTNLINGLTIFSIGMFKKIIISNYLSSIADPVFSNIENGLMINTLEAWIGLFAFSLQIYFDFSGYTDMAIGLACCFGFILPINFNSPYKSTSIKDFWSNWHITLSRFLRMHIYIPLGGNRIGSFKQVKNIFITMLIGGIWHGASWNFLLWGGYHGFLIVLEKITKSIIGVKIPLVFNKYFIFILITIGWVPFRCQSISSTKLMLKNLFLFKNINLNIYTNNLHIEVISIILIFLFVMFLPNSNQIQSDLKRVTIKNKYLLLLYLVFAYAVIFFLLAEPNQNINREFIYFQF